MPSAPQRSPQRDLSPRRPPTTSPRPRAAEDEPRPLRDDIPDAVWKGFDSAIKPLRPKIRGAFTRYVGLLQTAFTLDQLEAVLRRDGNLEAIVSSPDGEELKRPAREELYDLYLGPRRPTRAERDASKTQNLSVIPATARHRPAVAPEKCGTLVVIGPDHRVFNAVRDSPAKAPVVATMLATSKVAAATSAGISRGWWNSLTMEEEMIAWAKLNAAARVTSITDGTRAGIRQIVTSAFDFEDGTDRDGIARALRALDGTDGKVRLGLDAPRQKTFMKYLNELDPSIPAKRRKLLGERRYRQLLKQRRGVIARTEALTVGNNGQDLTWKRAAADGTLDVVAYVLIWITRAIRVCPRCIAMRKSTREIEGGEFVSDGTGPRGIETKAVPDLHVGGFCIATTGRRDSEQTPGQPPPVGGSTDSASTSPLP